MNTIAFIDSGVASYATLARSIKAQTKVVILDSQGDGVKQITQALQQENYQEVHLISHGSPGCLDLGNSQLSLDTLGHYSSGLKNWFSNSFFQSPHCLLIYGCNAAAGDAGAEFVAQLQQLTGANIAASASLTGNAALGGNWELEVTTDRDLDLNLVIDKKTQLAYQGVLADFTVTTTEDQNDGGDGGAALSLREAIALANKSGGEDTITFDSSLSGGTIGLTQTESDPRGFEFNQDLGINDSVDIVGLGAKNLTIDGLNGGNGIFSIGGESTNVNLEGLTITNGTDRRFFFNDAGSGGAIKFSGANLTLKDSVITNSSADIGGAIASSGNVDVIGSTISNNSGAGVSNPSGAIDANSLNVINSTVSDNRDRGISAGTLNVTNSTVSDNNTSNTNGGNSGFATEILARDGTATVTSSVIAGKSQDQNGGDKFTDLSGEFISGGNNLIAESDNASGFANGKNGDLVGTTENPIDPKLGELQDNGGTTPTKELLDASPALDAGSNPGNLATDQRGEGFDRTAGNGTDIGAYEVQAGGNGGGGNCDVSLVVTTLDDENDGDLSKGDISLREAIQSAKSGDTVSFDSSLNGGTITLSLGELLVDKSLNIENLGANNLTIDAAQQSRVFNLDDGQDNTSQNISFQGLNITGGGNVTDGGGIYNQESLKVSNTTLNENVSGDRGGAIANNGTVDISNSTIAKNSATAGGGINNSDSGVLNLDNTTISDNLGGGVFNANSATANSSIIANNTSYDVVFTTVTPGTNTDDDVIGTKAFTSGGNNLIGRVDGFGASAFDSSKTAGFGDDKNGDLIGMANKPINPQLGELQDNGGATLTQELLTGSPAVDAGSNLSNLATDQRGEGFNRTVGDGTDIGAFEVQNTGDSKGGDTLLGNNGNNVFPLEPGKGADVFSDFTDGVDLFSLNNGLSFGSLNIVNNDNTNGTLIQDANDNNRLLASIENVDPTSLTEKDFMTL